MAKRRKTAAIALQVMNSEKISPPFGRIQRENQIPLPKTISSCIRKREQIMSEEEKATKEEATSPKEEHMEEKKDTT